MEIKYNNIYIQYVMITQNRQRVILEKNRNRIEKYITGIISNNSSKLYSIYANPEHVHYLVSKSPKISEERLLTIVADSSKAFINDNNLTPGYFRLQSSASAFSISKGDVRRVCRYIENQPEHHKKVSFLEESLQFQKFYQETIRTDK